MADLATERIRLQDLTAKRSTDGARIVRDIPWQVVTYPGGTSGLEPVDAFPVARLSSSISATPKVDTDKQVTGIQGMDEGTVFRYCGTGGDVSFPAG